MTLAQSTRRAIQELAELYPERRTALLPALKLAQAEVGWLPPEAIAETADLVGVPHSAALELAVFYTMLHTEPGPATRVVVCAQLPCALRGAEQLIRDLRSSLAPRIAEGSLEVERTSECFGACHRAPMARVGDVYRENLDGDGRQRLIGELNGSTNGRAR
ncbi:MAG: NAD(P)H-dependent oxidoreductase subunit E [Chloroflexi bacterium]|nr:NAD(P)H-dependent oxidoreductase subunit E [Chloroflexota bacterium]